MLVESCVEIHKVGEEAACRNLACELVEIIVAVFGQVAYAAFLFPNLDREDGCRTIAYAFVGGVEQFADYAAAFCRSICAVVDGAEHNLIASAAVDGVHIMDERLHCLVNTAHCAVYGMLLQALFTFKPVERRGQIIIEFCISEEVSSLP